MNELLATIEVQAEVITGLRAQRVQMQKEIERLRQELADRKDQKKEKEHG